MQPGRGTWCVATGEERHCERRGRTTTPASRPRVGAHKHGREWAHTTRRAGVRGKSIEALKQCRSIDVCTDISAYSPHILRGVKNARAAAFGNHVLANRLAERPLKS